MVHATATPRAGLDAARLAAGLRRFVGERLDAFACSEERHDPKATARAVGDLTRCLKELVALERALGAERQARGEDEDDGADLDAGTASRLADVVAREVERLHEREREGGDLGGV
ncbi:hypothetical protein [Salinarimonas ramus]|uniref:Uncharacterized protein n=1 Tax=Salinarimonas ramus TaxID=690164 RepID=A0A917V392_9HYPH|nr:hypothetical protein [Salinarimonas ramus]GGK29880.1 hypothetical protein GCM10011322_15460 [Salinarimonas ramus]